jgi:putative acetyltransferase
MAFDDVTPFELHFDGATIGIPARCEAGDDVAVTDPERMGEDRVTERPSPARGRRVIGAAAVVRFVSRVSTMRLLLFTALLSRTGRAMSDVRFRRAGPEDAEEILSIKRAAIEDLEHWQYSPEQVDAWKPKDSYLDTFEEAIDDDRFIVHVGERDDRIVGYGALNVPDERIDAVYVHPDHHGHGVATALVKQLELSAQFQGIENIDIVAARNAVPFYESVGYWQLDDEVTTIEDVDVVFVRMRKHMVDGAEPFDAGGDPADAPDPAGTDDGESEAPAGGPSVPELPDREAPDWFRLEEWLDADDADDVDELFETTEESDG